MFLPRQETVEEALRALDREHPLNMRGRHYQRRREMFESVLTEVFRSGKRH